MKRYWILAIGCWLVAAGMQADEVMKIDASKVQQIKTAGTPHLQLQDTSSFF